MVVPMVADDSAASVAIAVVLVVVLPLAGSIALGLWGRQVLRRKGRSGAAGFCLGFFVGFIGVLIAHLLAPGAAAPVGMAGSVGQPVRQKRPLSPAMRRTLRVVRFLAVLIGVIVVTFVVFDALLDVPSIPGRSVRSLIQERSGRSVELLVVSHLLAAAIAGVIARSAVGSPSPVIRRLAGYAASVGASVPTFLLACVLLWLFAVELGWFPAAGYAPVSGGLGHHVRSLVLPVASLTAGLVAVHLRRVSRAAPAGGVGAAGRFDHGAGSAWRATFSLLRGRGATGMEASGAVIVGTALGGLVVVEAVYSIPGVGALLVQSLARADGAPARAVVLVMAVAALLAKALGDGAERLLLPGASPRPDAGRPTVAPPAVAALDRRSLTADASRPGVPPEVLVLGSILGVIVFAVLIGSLLVTDPTIQDLQHSSSPAFTDGHLLGTDRLGRDLLARLLVGARRGLLTGLAAMALGLLVGGGLGLLAGRAPGWVDALIGWIRDVLFAFPTLIVALVVAVAMRSHSGGLVVAVAIAQLPHAMAFGRALMRAARRTTARAELVRHLVAFAVGAVGAAMAVAAAVSFLGFGTQPPGVDLGVMIGEGVREVSRWPHLLLLPGLLLVALLVVLDLLAEAIRRWSSDERGAEVPSWVPAVPPPVSLPPPSVVSPWGPPQPR